ncbi:hypothetical protein A3C26_01045 [Candidatus Daviesbacteria bacterium RIFCSPHIGHO2_02_FULL_39_12]|uniref:Glycosyltransferase RgtA/B/C/D-like domain-containing protein n=2 Tax=Candidatus Daviesiibacteriota TaxID=1752718 RepID=A0A1F5JDY8_9BACT|nr:MAG: hypothetical protein A3C26_01045 [Candidatus Daviesbacteria bacterium RIFCSPHIGHO2_02_FULL_39_12]OGE72638.1 MAG: hypothetical protein A3H40_01115 [Candidatus Daviesbacteria bacterium RIFCSPLOWO2_02_FULL_38_15]
MNTVPGKNNIAIVFSIFSLILFIYIFTAGRFKFIFPTHSANYFSHLSYSFLMGRLYLVNPTWTSDLSIWHDKKYVYWGPTPVLFILPLVALFGVNLSDALYTSAAGFLSVFFVYLILNELNKLNISRLSEIKKILICLFFAFGTVHYYLSVNGGIWFTSQIFSTMYAFVAIFFLLRYLTYQNLSNLLLSSIFFNLAAFGRNTFIFYLPLFIILIVYKRFNLKHLVLFSLILFIFLSANFLYNFLRFGSIFETGHSIHQVALKFAADKASYGTINPIYIPKNFKYMFLNFAQPTDKFPFFKFDQDGNSIFFTSSLFLLLFLLIKKQFWKEKLCKILNIFCLIGIFGSITFLLNYFSTGWIQLGYRYLLDVIPLMLLLIAEVVSGVPIFIILLLTALSIIVTSLGTVWLIFQ